MLQGSSWEEVRKDGWERESWMTLLQTQWCRDEDTLGSHSWIFEVSTIHTWSWKSKTRSPLFCSHEQKEFQGVEKWVMGSSSRVSDGGQSQATVQCSWYHRCTSSARFGSNPEQRVSCRGNGKRTLIGERILYTSVSKYGDSWSSRDPPLEIIEVLLCCHQKQRWAKYQNVLNPRLSMMFLKCTVQKTVTTTMKERK